jgi:hypothetical protein
MPTMDWIGVSVAFVGMHVGAWYWITHTRREMRAIDIQSGAVDLTPHWQPNYRVDSQGLFDDHLEVGQLLCSIKTDVLVGHLTLGAKLFGQATRDAFCGKDAT